MANDAISRKMAGSKEAHAKMIDDAIQAVHNAGPNAPKHIAIPVMHALLLGKHFALNGLKVPEHLQDPPIGETKPDISSKDSGKSSEEDEEQDSGD